MILSVWIYSKWIYLYDIKDNFESKIIKSISLVQRIMISIFKANEIWFKYDQTLNSTFIKSHSVTHDECDHFLYIAILSLINISWSDCELSVYQNYQNLKQKLFLKLNWKFYIAKSQI